MSQLHIDKVEPKKKPSLKQQQQEDRKMVRGKFVFHECPGGTMMFSFRKYKEDPVENFSLTDGQIYTVPLGVAKHLNTNCWYPKHEFTQTEGTPIPIIGKKVRRCSFQSLEFMDIEELDVIDPKTITDPLK